MAKLIFGCGYLGERVARRWLALGETVYAVTRSADRATLWSQIGLRPIVADITADQAPALPAEIDTVLFAVGYDRQPRAAGSAAAPSSTTSDAPPSIHDVYVGGLARALSWLPPSTRRLIYISSTGVYGDATGSEVDETSPCQPQREGGRACLAAEQLLHAPAWAERSVILRLAGIYGPGRIPRSADLLAGRPIDAPREGWLNLIHVDDAAGIVLQAANADLSRVAGPRPVLYVVSDGQAVPRGEYYQELARLLGAPPPQFVEPTADSPAAARAASDKRVMPHKLLREIAPTLVYPNYRAGLAAIVGQSDKNGP
ncbi:MAG: SDR family oxidoreductase [Pirellulaceae bacterium]|nr:SDR family oxidoreductase [Pirellulaceae bacterium]